jgi:hypothetical protein
VTRGAGLHARTHPINAVRPPWMARGVCVVERIPTEVFYRAYDQGPAMEACERCPVQVQCLEFVLLAVPTARDFGIWGATTERDRRRMRKDRAQAVVTT